MSALLMTTRPSLTTAVVSCARCGHAMTAAAWDTLPMERTLTSAEVGGHLITWPNDAIVEVRRCSGCDGPIARRTHTAR
jgi:hypothetical protein